MLTSQAQEVGETTQTDQAISIYKSEIKEFKFVDEEEGAVSNHHSPIRIRIENIKGDQADLRMIWKLNDRSYDEVFKITLTHTPYESVPMVPDGSPQPISDTISFNDTAGEKYNGNIYLTDMEEYGGIQLLLKDSAGFYSKDGEQFMLMTEIPAQTESQESESNEDSEDSLTLEPDFADLHKRIDEWSQQMGEEFYHINLEKNMDLDHAGLTLHDLMNHMAFNGNEIHLDSAQGYERFGVYSNSITDDVKEQPITYILVAVNDEPQVWVSEQTDTSRRIEFKLSENAELQQLFSQWYQSNRPEERGSTINSPFEKGSLADMLLFRDDIFTNDKALDFVEKLKFSAYPDIELQIGTNTVTLEENNKSTITIDEKAPGYYYFYQETEDIIESFKFFMYDGEVLLIFPSDQENIYGSYNIFDLETLQLVASSPLTEEQADQLSNADKMLGISEF